MCRVPTSENAHAEECGAGHDCKYCSGEARAMQHCNPGLSIQLGPGRGRWAIVPCSEGFYVVTATNASRAEDDECDEELNNQQNGYELFH